jgi:hypothetical protein
MAHLASGQSVGEALARGEGDIGFTQVSEFLHIKDINNVVAALGRCSKVIVFSAIAI